MMQNKLLPALVAELPFYIKALYRRVTYLEGKEIWPDL